VTDQPTDRPDTPLAGGVGQPPVRPDVGWVRAILSGFAIVALGFVGTVELPNLIVVHLDGLTTFTRSLLAGAMAITVVLALGWGLRRLQARRLI